MFIQLSIMLICVLLCLLPPVKLRNKTNINFHAIVEHNNIRVRYILPLCFIIITIFFAIRYNYGLDYWHYYERFSAGWTQRQFESGSSEALFYLFMNSFDSYFTFIIVHTLILMASLYYLTWRNCDYRYYALFFFIFLANNELATNMISALRNSMAASILWIGLDLFYIRKKRWLQFAGVVIFAFFFHTSVIVFLMLPIMDVFIMKVKPRPMFIILCLLLFFRLSFANMIFGWAGANVPFLQTYEHILDKKDVEYNFNSIIYFSCMLFPSYFICKRKRLFIEKGCSGVYVLGLFFLFMFLTGLDFEGRFSIYLMVFFIYSLSIVMTTFNVMGKAIALLPLTVFILYGVYLTYTGLLSSEYLLEPGNPLFYNTIFDASPM